MLFPAQSLHAQGNSFWNCFAASSEFEKLLMADLFFFYDHIVQVFILFPA